MWLVLDFFIDLVLLILFKKNRKKREWANQDSKLKKDFHLFPSRSWHAQPLFFLSSTLLFYTHESTHYFEPSTWCIHSKSWTHTMWRLLAWVLMLRLLSLKLHKPIDMKVWLLFSMEISCVIYFPFPIKCEIFNPLLISS